MSLSLAAGLDQIKASHIIESSVSSMTRTKMSSSFEGEVARFRMTLKRIREKYSYFEGRHLFGLSMHSSRFSFFFFFLSSVSIVLYLSLSMW